MYVIAENSMEKSIIFDQNEELSEKEEEQSSKIPIDQKENENKFKELKNLVLNEKEQNKVLEKSFRSKES